MAKGHTHVMTFPMLRPATTEDASYSSLARAAVQGDRGAFDELMGRHEKELRGFLVRRVGREDVDDVIQDTWLAAWTSLHAYSGRCRFKTWLYSIALFKVRDHYRRRSRDRTWQSVDIQDVEIGIDPADTELDKNLVRGALENLSTDQRQLLELYYYAELTLAEIAQVLGKSLSLVKYRFYRAHRDVADQMQGYHGR